MRGPARTAASVGPLAAALAFAPLLARSAAAAPSEGAAPTSESGATAASPKTKTKTKTTAAVRPPRHDGPYVGTLLYPGAVLARVNNLDTPGPFVGFGGSLLFGQMVLPWLGLGLQLSGGFGTRRQQGARQKLGMGGFLVDLDFVPAPRIGLELRASFGFGGGAITQAGHSGRGGFGGAMFGAGIRYLFFPGASRYRAHRGGGFGLGPEIGWLGATPAAKGRPMAHMLYAGLVTIFFFGS